MATDKKNIYQKLLEIQKEIKGLGKDEKGYGYQYVTGSKVLSHVKPLMNKHNLILKQEVLSIDNSRQDYQVKSGNKSEVLSKVMMKFTWVDCDTGEKDENLFGANGQNDWEKGLGSALTYAERYFLLKFFHIATDEDDIDNSNRKTSPPLAKPQESKEKVGDNDGKGEGKPALSQERFEKMKQALGKDKDKYTPDVNKTLSKVSATEEQIKTLKGMMA